MQPQYPPAPQYPPQQPQQPYAPPAPPQQPYAPPAPPQYPQQPYAPPAPPQYAPQYQQPTAPAAQPVIPGTLDQFYSQPSTGGGKALTFEAPGTSYTGIVTRQVGDGDIAQQTDTQGRPAFFRDGRPKFVMKVPLQLQPSPAYPDGLAQWFVKGQARDELVRAMTEAGAPEGPPEGNAVITITMTGSRPSGPGMNPTKLFRVEYRRPQGAHPPAPVAATAQPAPAPVQQPHYQPAPPPVYATNGNGTTTSTMTLAPPVAAVATSPAPPPPPAGPPAELSAAQRELLATLTGQAPQQ